MGLAFAGFNDVLGAPVVIWDAYWAVFCIVRASINFNSNWSVGGGADQNHRFDY